MSFFTESNPSLLLKFSSLIRVESFSSLDELRNDDVLEGPKLVSHGIGYDSIDLPEGFAKLGVVVILDGIVAPT